MIQFTKNVLNKTSLLLSIEQFEIFFDYVVEYILFQKPDFKIDVECSAINNFFNVLQTLIDKGIGLALKRIRAKIQMQKLYLEFEGEDEKQGQKLKVIYYIEEAIQMQYPGKFFF